MPLVFRSEPQGNGGLLKKPSIVIVSDGVAPPLLAYARIMCHLEIDSESSLRLTRKIGT